MNANDKIMAAAGAPILFERNGAIASIRFNRPAALNVIDQPTAECLLAICREISASTDIKVVVLSGEGRAFMAGGDLVRFHEDKAAGPQTAHDLITPFHEALAILAGMPQLVIGSVHGAVAGAGVSVAVACDLCIAADNAQFNMAYARIGTSPDGAATWSLPRLVGLRKAMELALMSETVGASEALRLGLVNRVVPAESLVEATQELAERLAGGPGLAYGRIKQLLRASQGNSLQQQLDAEREAFCASAGTADFAEGIDAFFEKRKPAFQGR